MGFDEFSEKLRKIRAEFKLKEGRDMETIAELERFLDRRLVKPKSRAARSLKGLF